MRCYVVQRASNDEPKSNNTRRKKGESKNKIQWRFPELRVHYPERFGEMADGLVWRSVKSILWISFRRRFHIRKPMDRSLND